ncbi:DUF4411 family protein [Acidipropionibacterium acidipropionici]|jgi:hypothetical protein|uniref:DUF4411 family protein n=1 Tax=Acidipropionibacterium acidipropionici TaxID=1748 RepID=UPI00110B223E|nr:DUF4411 family protein [Acidipropionibacterium acidipropionici]QCV96224.1 DUF4411 family protein [Acidipropionibacterium acidipropionici]
MFLLDSNVFIEASRLYYSAKIAPGFWTWLAEQHFEGNVGSVPSVKKEILDGTPGPLTDWARGLPTGFWIEPEQSAVVKMQEVAQWTMDPNRQYTPAARAEFLSIADYVLVATAYARRDTVVTREQPAPNAKTRILIPDVCKAFSVRCQDPFSMYTELGLLLTV